MGICVIEKIIFPTGAFPEIHSCLRVLCVSSGLTFLGQFEHETCLNSMQI